MRLLDNSITIVILGDWNKLFIQPDWIALNVFESEEIEIGVEGKGSEVSISYQKDKVIIKPSQSKVMFSTLDIEEDTLEVLSKYVRNFIDNSFTPEIRAYGFNIDYVDDEDTRIADVLDSMSDTAAICGMDFEIAATQISRKLIKDGKEINMKCELNGTRTKIHFNEHFSKPNKDNIVLSADVFTAFIRETADIIVGLGYSIEGEEDE